MKYFADFEDYESMTRQWNGSDSVKDEEVICSTYNPGDYCGDAHCYFLRDGQLFEVHDSHCSCFGLEDFEPEKTSFGAVLMRKDLSDVERALITAAQAKEQQ